MKRIDELGPASQFAAALTQFGVGFTFAHSCKSSKLGYSVGASQLSRYCKFFVFFCSVTWNRTFSYAIFTRQLLYLLTLLFYFEGRWACRTGILALAGRLVLAFATGLLGAATRQWLRLERGQRLTNLVSFRAAVAMLLSVAMMAVCAGGLGKSLTTCAVSLESGGP